MLLGLVAPLAVAIAAIINQLNELLSVPKSVEERRSNPAIMTNGNAGLI